MRWYRPEPLACGSRPPRSSRSASLVNLFLATSVVLCGCASSTPANEPEPATPSVAEGPADCIVVDVENNSLTGVAVWIEWENAAPQRMGRLSINTRRSYRLLFRNAQITVRFQPDGESGFATSNPVLPAPGDRLDVRYGNQGTSPFHKTGVASC